MSWFQHTEQNCIAFSVLFFEFCDSSGMDLGKGRKVRTWGGRNGRGKLSRNEAGAALRVQHLGDERNFRD